MTFERWLIVLLIGGLIAANLLLLVLVYLTKESKAERRRCEKTERNRSFFAGWNSAMRVMEADEHNYCPKEWKEGDGVGSFKPKLKYHATGDFLSCFFVDCEYYGERIDDLLTVYKHNKTDEIVGCKIKGIKRVMKAGETE